MADDVRRPIREAPHALTEGRSRWGGRWLSPTIAVIVLWTVVGLLRAVLTVMMRPGNLIPASAIFELGITVNWLWVPVTLWILRDQRRRLRNPRTFAGTLWHHAPAFLSIAVAESWWTHLLAASIRPETAGFVAFFFLRFDTNLVIYVACVLVAWTWVSWQQALVSAESATRLETMLAGTQVDVLTMQLQPHFLFNSLHLVSEMAYETGVDAARATLGRLRDLLAQSFAYAAQREVCVREEVTFLHAYVDIQQRRFRDRLSVSVEVDPRVLDARIPHLVLQPLVENAIQHGIAPLAAGGTVRVRIGREGDRLIITVEDTGHGVRTAPALSAPTGMGVSTTLLRLERLYPGDFHFEPAHRNNFGMVTRVDIPLRPWTAAALTGATTNAFDTMASQDNISDAAAPSIDPPRTWTRLRIATTVLLGWLIVAVLWTQVTVLGEVAEGMPVVWSRLLTLFGPYLVNAGVGAALTLPAFAIARRNPVRRHRVVRDIARLLGTGLGVALLDVWLVWAALWPLGADQQHEFRATSAAWVLWAFVAWLACVALAQRAPLAAWHRDIRLAAVNSRNALAQSQAQLARLQLQPAMLIGSLDAVREAEDCSAEQFEDAISHLGDRIRGVLAAARQDAMIAANPDIP